MEIPLIDVVAKLAAIGITSQGVSTHLWNSLIDVLLKLSASDVDDIIKLLQQLLPSNTIAEVICVVLNLPLSEADACNEIDIDYGDGQKTLSTENQSLSATSTESNNADLHDIAMSSENDVDLPIRTNLEKTVSNGQHVSAKTLPASIESPQSDLVSLNEDLLELQDIQEKLNQTMQEMTNIRKDLSVLETKAQRLVSRKSELSLKLSNSKPKIGNPASIASRERKEKVKSWKESNNQKLLDNVERRIELQRRILTEKQNAERRTSNIKLAEKFIDTLDNVHQFST